MAVDLAADFTQFTLTGGSINNPTSLQFGPDGRLYVAQQDGLLKIFTIQKTTSGYQVTATETISLIKDIPNHNDDGSLNGTVTSRQVTGLLVTGTAAAPVIYVGSSDPRIAVGSDSGLDTNSGIISRLTLGGNGQWDKVDLVRGLPRSEENHSVNGLQYDEAANQLYVTVGGNTNMGAPSNSFGYLPEYAYSAAILKVDLNAIDAMTVKTDSSSGTAQKYLYDLPTLNDPTRGDATETVFGGNDGLNMAKIVAGGPVQIFSPGFRNPYDFVIAESGKMYTIDNGPNQNWGGLPVFGSNGITNQASASGGVTNSDTLHLVTAGYYGGHPNPIRANGSAAGLTDSDGSADGVPDGALMPTNELPSDFGQVVFATNAKEATYKHPGGDAPALWTNGQSTNGIAEYTASKFDNELKGDLLTVGYGGTLYRLDLNSSGTAVQGVSTLSIGGTPLDVIAQGDDQPFAGSIWVAKYGADSIMILEPEPPTTTPPQDDDDGDGLSNTIDRFGLDAANGMATVINAGETLTWSLSATDPNTPGPSNSLFNLGLTGLMVNLNTPYSGLYDIENITPGGAGGVMTIDAVSAGTAKGSLNTQLEAFQFGVTPAAGTNFTVVSELDNPFNDIASPANDQSQGIYIGTGDQDNYLAITAHANGGAGGIQIMSENNGAVTTTMYAAAGLTAAGANDDLSLWLDVDVAAGLVTPHWSYSTNNGAQNVEGQGNAVTVSGALLLALRGSYTVNSQASGVAVGMIGTSAGPGAPFTASWDNFQIIGRPGSTPSTPGAATMQINAGATIDTSTYNANSFVVTNTGQQNIVSVTFDTRTNALPGIVFDPAGTAGDTVAKNLKIDSFGSTGAVQPAANDYSAFSVANNGGYNVMTVTFNPNVNSGFNPGETVKFSVDIDPLNIKNSGIDGDAGSVSGLELTGSKVTVTYADGTTQTSEIIGDGSAGGGEAGWSQAITTAPTLTLAGKTSGQVSVTTASQTVQVTGTPNSTATVMIMTGGSGNNVQPASIFDANKAIAVEYRQVALNSSGSGSFSFTVPQSNPVFLSATVDGGAAGPGHVSPALIVAMGSGTTPPTSYAINNGGAGYTDADTGIVYVADSGQYANGGSTFSSTHAITGTNDASLYNNQRYSPTGNLIYNVPIASGSYEVTLKFSEIYSGITGPGQRIFDVTAEGALVIDNLDVYQQVGPYAAYDWTGTVNVTDGNLTLEFLKGAAQNPFISAISIKPAGTAPPPINGTAGDDYLPGTSGNDTINGLAGNDWLDGLAGSDTLNGGTGHDGLDGGTGADLLSGGPGDDLYIVDNSGDQVTELSGEGNDWVKSTITYTLPANVEHLILDGSAALNGTGNSLANSLWGNSAANTLDGGANNDLVVGLGGADNLAGGAGNDTFIYYDVSDSQSSALDNISDFTQGQDKFDLSAIDANSALSGDQAFAFIGAAAFSGAAGQLRYQAGGSATNIFADINGDGIADMQIQLVGNHALVQTDFVL